MNGHVGERAVVLGGSVAGLLAARVLAEAYTEVLIVDRDELQCGAGPRRGVPQGRHAHGLLARGQVILEKLFPGLTSALSAEGVPTGDLGRDLRWYFNGRRIQPVETGLVCVSAARPILEQQVRTRVLALPNVTVREQHDIVGPRASPDRSRVTGVDIQHRVDRSGREELAADLVVDTTGRASRTPAWLDELGYQRPPEQRIKIGLSYTTRHYRLPGDLLGGDLSIIPVATPRNPRGAFFAWLGDRFLLSLTGVLGDQPAPGERGFLEYVKSLPVPDIFEAVHDAEPLDDPVTHQYPASVRRHYEHLSRLPDGLLVMGDAACSFNPVYGQGMTVAAMEALELKRLLGTGAPPRPRQFYRSIAKVIDAPWDISAGSDLAHPGVPGRRSAKVRLVNAYMTRLQAAAAHDGTITEAFMRTMGLLDPPEDLLRPSMLLRVARHHRTHGAADRRR